MSCQLRAQSPWGANALVSKPNQATPVNRTSRPLASTILAPAVRRGTLSAVFALGGGGTTLVGAGNGVAETQGAGCPGCGALPCGALPCGALPCGALPGGALPWGALACGALRCGAVAGGAVAGGALDCGALPCGALPCGALP